MRLCINCQHYESSGDTDGGFGSQPCCVRTIDPPNRVNGKRRQRFLSCFQERWYGWFECRLYGTCGKEGRFWESETITAHRAESVGPMLPNPLMDKIEAKP
jgi:hypothetical protein